MVRRLIRNPEPKARYPSLAEFYPHYLAEHTDPINRALHVVGTGTVIALTTRAVAARKPRLLLGALIAGYGLAWVGHLLFERNKPATFRQPLYSLASDFLMFRDVLLGRLDRARIGALPPKTLSEPLTGSGGHVCPRYP